MKTLHFSKRIKASPAKIWQVLWDDATYREWTRSFSEGSYAVSDWEEGSPVKFLSPSGDGMYSSIEKLIPNKLMSFKHLGVIKNGVDMPQDDESRSWSGSREVYSLNETGVETELLVDVDTTEAFAEYLSKTFPLALEKVKDLSESGNA